ncbi:hypothetical protein F6X51_01425 [Methylobacterium planeticum]|uniref:Uncharacterized protein n=1 Tax=Methylobacterium planeticum TaxID=2615211 RepID=A0A6N6MYJ8_9HYPH|nr:hypothetical protein F6X51_01425 [Methylobacterium planeticum]
MPPAPDPTAWHDGNGGAPPLPSGRGRVGASRPGEGCDASGEVASLTPTLSRTGEGARRATRARSNGMA